VIATTHYSELKTYAYNDSDISNASVEFNNETLKPTYRLLIGIPGKSNAIMIAKRLGLNEKIIDDALLEMDSKSNESSDVIKNLEDELLSVKKKEKELDEKLLEQNRINKELINEKNNLIKSTDKLINEAKEKAKSIIENSKKESEKLLNEIKNLSSESYKEHEMINLKTKMRNLDIQNEESVIKDTFNVGDFVLIKTY
jgi:DNA mismatch repair protein MutS2